MRSAGQQLRAIREQLGLTLRDVEAATQKLAEKHGDEEFIIQLSRLSDIETKGLLPNIHRLYALAVIYRRDFHDLLRLYGVDVEQYAADLLIAEPRKSHRLEGLPRTEEVRVPVRLDPAFDLRKTTNLGRMIESWGVVPMSMMQHFEHSEYSYGYIGADDLAMYPLLQPGSFVQIDESKDQVVMEAWRSEYERPIYFVETREGFACAWCSIEGERLALHPHPLSPQKLRLYKHPGEAEIVGQIVGVAMRLGVWKTLPPAAAATSKKSQELN